MHSSGPGGPSDQRKRALHQSNASTSARFSPVGMIASLFAIAALGLLSCSLVAIAGKATQKSATTTSRSWASLIAEASQRFGVPAHWVRAIMQAESTDDTGAMSPKGAMGLMQVMPETYTELQLRYHLGADPYEPYNNILAGAAYLREMYDRFGPDGFLAAYNAGPGRYEDYLKSGRPLPEETRNYVATLAPVIGAAGIPYHSAGTSTTSQLTTSGAAHGDGEHLKASSKDKFRSAILQFDDRQNVRTKTLFAIARAAFEFNFGQCTNDRYDCTRTATKSRIECDFECGRKFANSHVARAAILVGSERRCALCGTINTHKQVR